MTGPSIGSPPLAEHDRARAAAATGLAAVLAALHLAAALGKVLDLGGFADVLADYRLFPAAALMPLAVAVTLTEALIAAGLLLPRFRHAAALAAGAMALGYGVTLTVTLLRGIELANCGCFGVFLARPLTPLTPLEDLLLLGLALLLLWLTPGRRVA
jgi:hypothetical protein